MAQLRHSYSHFLERDAEVLVVGPDDEKGFSSFFKEHELPFIGLPDVNHSVLKLFGQEVKIFKFGRQPAQMIIDKAGILRYVHYGHNMSDIPDTAEMLELLDKLQGESLKK